MQPAWYGEMYCHGNVPRTFTAILGESQEFLIHPVISAIWFGTGSGVPKDGYGVIVECIDIDGVNPGLWGGNNPLDMGFGIMRGTGKQITYRVRLTAVDSSAVVGFQVYLKS